MATLTKEGDPTARLNRLSDEIGVLRDMQREIAKRNEGIEDESAMWTYTTKILENEGEPLLYVRAKQLAYTKEEAREFLKSTSVKYRVYMDGTIEIGGSRTLFKGKLGPTVDLPELMQEAFEHPQVRYFTRTV